MKNLSTMLSAQLNFRGHDESNVMFFTPHEGEIACFYNVEHVYHDGKWLCLSDKLVVEPLKIFISGPMTGYEHYNFPKFDETEKKLLSLGYNVVNPANISRRYKRKDVESNRSVYDEMVKEQIAAERKCNAILLLDGWQKSNGVRRELELALLADMKVLLESDIQELENESKTQYNCN